VTENVRISAERESKVLKLTMECIWVKVVMVVVVMESLCRDLSGQELRWAIVRRGRSSGWCGGAHAGSGKGMSPGGSVAVECPRTESSRKEIRCASVRPPVSPVLSSCRPNKRLLPIPFSFFSLYSSFPRPSSGSRSRRRRRPPKIVSPVVRILQGKEPGRPKTPCSPLLPHFNLHNPLWTNRHRAPAPHTAAAVSPLNNTLIREIHEEHDTPPPHFLHREIHDYV